MAVDKPKTKKDKNILDVIRKRNCDCCGKKPSKDYPNQACHIKSKGAGGPDEEWNLYTGCPNCHIAQHAKGWSWMFEQYPFFRQVIYQKGWILDGNKKLKRNNCA